MAHGDQSKRKPTRRDLLIVIGRLQNLIGKAIHAYENDRQFCRATAVREALNPAFDLCVEARSHDWPINNTGPWAAPLE